MTQINYIFISSFLLFIAGCSQGNQISESVDPKSNENTSQVTNVADGPTYIVATENSFPPFALKDERGLNSGYDADLIKAIAEKQGFNIEFKTLPWSDWPQTLNDGSVDIWISGIAITPERQKMVDFTTPYINRKTVVAVPKSSNIKDININNIKDYRVAVQTGTPDYNFVQEQLINNPDNLIPVKSNYLGLNALLTDQADILVGNDKVINYHLKLHPEIDISTIPLNVINTNLAFTVKKGNVELQKILNEGINGLQKDMTKYNEINRKWFGDYNVTQPKLEEQDENNNTNVTS